MSRKMQNLGQDILILNQKNRVYLEFFYINIIGKSLKLIKYTSFFKNFFLFYLFKKNLIKLF